VKIPLVIIFSLIILNILAQDYKVSSNGVSVRSKTVPVLNQNMEGQKNQNIFFADSIRFYDENLQTTDSVTFMNKCNSGEFISRVTFDPARSIMTYTMKAMPKPELSWIGKTVPKFDFKDIRGRRWNRNSIKGKVVVFHFWFTKCLPCIREFSLLNDLKKDNPEVLWFAISFEELSTIQSFLRGHKLDLNVIPNQQDFANLLNVKLYPRTIILDKNTTIQEVLCGPYQDSTMLQQKLNYYSDH
jgi:thiol-disulfide isomerase/thioredoxin